MTRAELIALCFLIAGLFLLSFYLVKIVRRLTYRPVEGKPRRLPSGVSYFAIFAAVLMLIFSWVLFWLGHQLNTFKPFNPPGVVGFVEASKENDLIKSIKIAYYSTVDSVVSIPTNFYLSGNAWKLEGQYLELPKYLEPIFQTRHFYKITDFYSGYIGFKPPGADHPLLAHQTIEGGKIDVFDYFRLIPLTKTMIRDCSFTHEYISVAEANKYNIALNDSCSVTIIEAK